MSAAVAFTRATITALSASVRMTGPLADLMYSVLLSTLSMMPATRWVCCCSHAEHTAVSPDGEVGAEGGSRNFLDRRHWFVGHGGAPFDTRPIPASLAGGAGGRPDYSISGHSVVRPAPSARPSKKRFCPPQPCATVAALCHIRVLVRIVSVPKKGGDRCARERFAISSRAQRWPPLRL